MESRTLDNLILENKDYIFEGNITIYDNVDIKNGDIIVSGNLTILGEVNIENGSIIVSGILTIAHDADICITGGDISCAAIDCNNINITDGDVWVNGQLDACDITSDGNIEVKGDAYVGDISCFNYLISGDNNSSSIRTTQDIYILGNNNSCDLTARDILIGRNCEILYDSIIAHHFVCGGELSCSGVFIE